MERCCKKSKVRDGCPQCGGTCTRLKKRKNRKRPDRDKMIHSALTK